MCFFSIDFFYNYDFFTIMINSKPNIFNCYIDNLKTTGFTTLVHFWLYAIGGSDEFESRTQIYENSEIPNKQTNKRTDKQTNRHLSNFIAECNLCFG